MFVALNAIFKYVPEGQVLPTALSTGSVVEETNTQGDEVDNVSEAGLTGGRGGRGGDDIVTGNKIGRAHV